VTDTLAEEAPRISRHSLEQLEPGHVVADKYVIESVLGDGATSIVYVARRRVEGETRASPAAREEHGVLDEESEPPGAPTLVALKIIHARLCEDPQIVGRFQREAAILKRLDGPHVLRVHEMLEDEGRLVLVLEYVPSKPLDRRLAESERLSVKGAIEIALQICAGLGTAHAAGVVHRDLKPANVLYSVEGEEERVLVKVADFGLAKLVHGDKMVTGLTEHDMIFGTPEYMAPEQARGEDVDARADIYALGCILYEMLTGDVPFRGHSPMVTMTSHLMQEVEPPRKRRNDGAISTALEAVVMRALAKRPQDRHASARAFAEALLAAESNPHIIATTAPADALSDTDLNVAAAANTLPNAAAVTGDAASVTAPAVPASTGPQETPSLAARRADLVEIDIDRVVPRGGPPWIWIAVAVIAAIAGIAIGVVAGTR
jgi:serine/threonine-protein kinase